MTRRSIEWRGRLIWAVLVSMLLATTPPSPVAAQTSICFTSPSPAEVGVGSIPRSVAIGDLNRDGKPDLGVANSNSNTVSIRLGAGDGTFYPPSQPEVVVGSFPWSVAIGDLNGDGRPDLAAANSGGNSVSIRLGNGDGTFSPPPPPSPAEVNVGTSPASVAIGDLNGDGKPDLAVANSSSNNVSIRLGAGDGTFSPPGQPEVMVHSGPQSVVIADLNRDGKPDLAVANSGSAYVSVRLGAGDGTFTSTGDPEVLVGSVPRSVAVGDLNGDGKPDLAAANENVNSVSIRLGVGDGTFSQGSTHPAGRPSSVTIGDLNGDGNPDLAAANSNRNTVSIQLGHRDGTFSQPSPAEVNVGTSPASVAIGDLNGDGKPDLAAANSNSNTVSIRLNCQVNAPPVVTVPSAQTTAEDTELTFSTSGGNAIAIADPDIGSNPARVSLSVSHGGLSLASQAGLTFTEGDGAADPIVTFSGSLANVNAALNGLTYLPAANFTGADQVSITAHDQGAGGQDGPRVGGGTVQITVTAVNDPPTAAPDAYTAQVGTALTVSAPGVLANDADVDSASLTAAKVTEPGHGTLALNPDGAFTYTPAPGFAGTDSFTYQAHDGTLASAPATVTIAVANAAPTAGHDTYVVQAGTTLTVNAPGVLGNDADPDPSPLTAVKASDPGHGGLTLNPNGGFSYTPAAGFTGTDSFTYRATDGITTSGVATVTIVVTAAPPPTSPAGPGSSGAAPIAANDSYSVVAGSVLTVNGAGVLANDADADSPSLTAVKQGGPSHGSLALNSDGSFTYTPKADFAGTDSFTYRASDGANQSSIATVSIAVTATQCGPRPRVQTTSVASGGRLQVRIEATPNPQQTNALKAVRLGKTQNAKVAVNGQPLGADQTFAVPAGATTVELTVERITPGQATTVPLTVVDGCGEWPTFVGGGAGAGF